MNKKKPAYRLERLGRLGPVIKPAIILLALGLFSFPWTAPLTALNPDVPLDRYVLDHWGEKEGLTCNLIVTIARTPDGYLWLATDNGLMRFDGIRFWDIPFVTSGGTTRPNTLFTDREGVLWIGSSAGLTQYRSETGQFKTFGRSSGFADDRVRRIREDVKGNLWIGHWVKYISLFDKTGSQRFTGFNESHGLEGKKINAILEDKMGRLLVGTREKGVYLFRDNRFHKHKIAGLTADDVVLVLTEDRKGRLWVGTGRGVLSVETDGLKTRWFTTAHGLSHNWVVDILEDSDGNLWIATMSGLNRLREGGRDQPGTYSIESRLEKQIITCLMEDNEKSLWICTDDSGLKRLRNEKNRINKIPPPVVIEAVFMGEYNITGYLRQGVEVEELSGSWQFHFTAPSFVSPEKIEFKYILDGHDSDWTTIGPGEPRIARYRDLSPGAYTFRVMACNSDGVWNKEGAVLAFSFKRCFQRTGLYKVLLAILVLMAISALVVWARWRSSRAARDKYMDPPLDSAMVDVCIKKLTYLMDIKHIYRDETLSLQSLAGKLDILPRNLSRILNEKLNKNFADYINTYRIEEVTKRLADPANGHCKIISIAFSAGFNSKAAFNNAFKKHTGMTPSEYRKTYTGK